MSGEPITEADAKRRRQKHRKRMRRRKKYSRELGDVEKEKIYMVFFFILVTFALIGLVGWGIWSLVGNLIETYG